MGHIFVLCGASGVGKTTLLNTLRQQSIIDADLHLIPRYTNRPRRPGELEGFEYRFCSYENLLQKVAANDFAYIEKWGEYYRGIAKTEIHAALEATRDYVILASVQGAEFLQHHYGSKVVITYLWLGPAATLRDLSPPYSDSKYIRAIERQLALRISQERPVESGGVTLHDDSLVNRRMLDNYLDIAAASGRLRSGHRLVVIQGSPEDEKVAMKSFMAARASETLSSAS